MDFMRLSRDDQLMIDFDVRSEIVEKDMFFERAKRYISTDEKVLLHRQALFSDVLDINGLEDFLLSFFEILTEYAPLMKCGQAVHIEERVRSILYPTAYIKLVRFVYENLYSFKEGVTSESLIHLYEQAKNDIESDEYKRLDQPEIYKVDLSDGLYELKTTMLDKIRKS